MVRTDHKWEISVRVANVYHQLDVVDNSLAADMLAELLHTDTDEQVKDIVTAYTSRFGSALSVRRISQYMWS